MSDTYFQFQIQRLVVVDSAGFCYVELPVDRHALLLGSGNLGKSSLLNALRLFLLPENNFKNSKRKFAFRNSKQNQYYRNEESFQHYFPGKCSFLIMEVSNPAGTHCQILHRADNLGYGRIFVPVAYDQLRHLFWNPSEDPDAIGRAVPELSIGWLSERLRKLSRNVVFTSDPARLRAMLYSSELMSADAIRYSVLPLTDLGEGKVESLRTLVLLLFEMNADDRAMAEAVASIVEADKKFSSDALDLDIDQFLQRHQHLKDQNERLVAVERERHRFERLQKRYVEYQQKARAQSEFAAFRDGLSSALEDARQRRELAARQVDTQDTLVKDYKSQDRALDRQLTGLAATIKDKKKELTEFSAIRRDGNTLLSRYPEYTSDAVVQILTEEAEEKEAHLSALQNDAAAEQRRKKLQKSIEATNAELLQFERKISDRRWQLHRQFPEEVVTPLAAIEPRLVQASPGKELEDEARAAITAFARLLKRSETGYQWFDEEFSARDSAPEDLEARHRGLLGEKEKLEQQLNDLAEIQSNAYDRPTKIAEAKRDLNALNHDLELLRNFAAADVTIERAENAIRENEASQEKAQTERNNLTGGLNGAERQLVQVKSDLTTIDQRQEELARIRQSVTALQNRIRHLEQTSADQAIVLDQITEESLSRLQLDIQDFESLRRDILQDLQHFLHAGMLEEHAESLQYESPTAGTIKDAFTSLDTLFKELPNRRKILQEQVEAHNDTVASYRHALKMNKDHIDRFQRRLNQELDGVSINDLAEVRVDIHCHPKFSNLVEESEALDPFASELLSDAFYERLRVFVAEFFGESNGARMEQRLTMDKIITGISYRTRKVNESGLDSKSQSTSTTMLINLELVQRLLRRVLSPGVHLSIPLVLDELPNVDVSQIPSLLERVKQEGFNLFAAATHSASSELIHQVGRHIELGNMHTRYPYDKRRTIVYWGGAEGFTNTSQYSEWLTAEQADLLEGGHG
ncbi:MAG: hypothetical protein WED00_16445 [Aquisalimonadaceae bacterium]